MVLFPSELERTQANYEAYLSLAREERKRRPKRKFYAAEISEDFGRSWTLKALCIECVRKFEPPTRVKRSEACGAKYCQGCDAINELHPD